jgi:hypothetical protein
MPTVLQPPKPANEVTAESDGSTTDSGYTEIRVKGKPVLVPSAQICGTTVIISGTWLKTASVHDEDLLEGETIANPNYFVRYLRQSLPRSDLFTFAQKLPNSIPKHDYHLEWENVAVIPITTYSEWWEKRTDAGARRAVRKAAKSGIVVKLVEFDDAFIRGIVSINNETPVRQGKPFWHFQKSFEAVKLENSTYADRNAFLGAYWQDELVGFIRMTYVDSTASILQMLTMVKHFDKKPANAMIAKAVEICEQKGLSYLMYCNYIYNDSESSLTEFKRRNGFEKMLLPRYYIPLTLKGQLAVRLRLHRGLAKSIPKSLLLKLLKLRSLWHARKYKSFDGKI